MSNLATIKNHSLDYEAIEIAFQLIALGKAISGTGDSVPDNAEPTKFGGSDIYSLGKGIADSARRQLWLIENGDPDHISTTAALSLGSNIVVLARAINNGLAGYGDSDAVGTLQILAIVEDLAVRQAGLLEAYLA